MRAKKVYESISFERGKDPFDALELGRHGIKRALLSKGFPKVDTLEGDTMRGWFDIGGLPDEFLEDIEYNIKDPLSFTDYASFDEDYYINNELPDDEDPEEFLKEFKPIGSSKSRPNKNRWGVFKWQEGVLYDGTKVFHYMDGMNSGFITKKDWIKKR